MAHHTNPIELSQHCPFLDLCKHCGDIAVASVSTWADPDGGTVPLGMTVRFAAVGGNKRNEAHFRVKPANGESFTKHEEMAVLDVVDSMTAACPGWWRRAHGMGRVVCGAFGTVKGEQPVFDLEIAPPGLHCDCPEYE